VSWVIKEPFGCQDPHFDVIIDGSPCSRPCSNVE
jgi:hypothetical protein